MNKAHLFDDAVPPSTRKTSITPPAAPASISGLNEKDFRSRGVALIQRSAAVSNEVLTQSHDVDGGDFGTKIVELTVAAKGFDPKHLARADSLIGWITGNWGAARERAVASFRTFSERVDGLVKELERHAEIHRGREETFARLFRENAELYRGLQALIADGRAEAEKEKTALAALPTPSDGMEAQLLGERRRAAGRFEKWLHDLDISLTLSLETGGQIVKMRDNGQALVDIFDTLTSVTIPEYRRQFALYLLQKEQEHSVSVGRKVNDATNAAIIKNAELLGMNAVAIAREGERGVVDMETVQAVYTKFIDGMEESSRVHREAEERRARETQELAALRQNFISRVSGPEGLLTNH